jgi:hypothetical protein
MGMHLPAKPLVGITKDEYGRVKLGLKNAFINHNAKALKAVKQYNKDDLKLTRDVYRIGTLPSRVIKKGK